MKLKSGFVLHDVSGEHMAVATGEAGKIFNGMVRNNDTANFIYSMLMNDTDEEKIIGAMLEEYDAPREVIEKDVHKIIEQLMTAGFLDG